MTKDAALPGGDLRDRRRAERFLGLAEALIDQAPVGLLVLDTDLRMVEVNPAMAALNGYPRAELLGEPVQSLLTGDSAVEPILREVLATGRPRLNVELRAAPPSDPDAEHTWLGSYYPLRGPDRELVGIGCLILDITERTRAEHLARAASARLAILAQASEVLGASLDVAATLQGLVDLTVPAFADLAVLDLVDESGSLRRHSTVTGKTDASRRPPGRGQAVPYPVGHPARRVLADHRSLLVPSLSEIEPDLSPDLDVAAGIRLLGLHSLVAVPLLGHEEVLGVATFARGTGQRPFDADDLALAEEIAVRAAVAVEHAARFTREREIALTLQRSLLPARLPEIEGLDVAWRYLPGTAGTEVGGDWFDLIPLPAGRVGIVVGDVMGRGVRAAAIMGQLRAAVRAYATLDLPPNEVMARMDDLVQGLEPPEQGQLVTCIYAIYDPGLRRCCLSNAGHLPPMVATGDGSPARVVTEASAAPLGVGGVPFTAAEIELAPGETLVLYTDGLIEHRGRDLDAGMIELRGLLHPIEGDLLAGCDELLDALRPDGDYDDDVALALLRVPADDTARGAELELPAGPKAAAAARRFAAEALDGWPAGIDAELVELLVSELVTNAVRHTSGVIGLRLRRTGSALYVEVTDNDTRIPRLRTTVEDEENGRGLHLVSELSWRWGVRPLADGKVVWFELSAG
jgi:PAS domain S-box-containing protein